MELSSQIKESQIAVIEDNNPSNNQNDLEENNKKQNNKVQDNNQNERELPIKVQNGHNQNFFQSFIERIKMLADEGDEQMAPKLSYLKLFQTFLWFGCRAFGGPFAQIQMMKQELVIDGKWVDPDRFIRVFAVYQALPGPEATELACYFGYLSRGRIGSIIGGLGFVLPGYLGMLLLSYLYNKYGLENKHVLASFHTIQITTCAMVFRAAYKLGETALMNSTKTEFNWYSGFLCLYCFLTSVLKLNFFISMAVCGVMNTFFELAKEKKLPWLNIGAFLFGAGAIGFYGLYVSIHGVPSESMIGSDTAVSGTSYTKLFELGLIAGMVTFGGAYTTLPFIYAAAVTSGGWLSDQQFLDSIAITNMMPTPLVTFVTVVGWIGHGIGGAIVIAIGIFLPAFSFTLIGHKFFESIVDNHFIHPFLDGIGASVIGLLLYTCFQFLKSIVSTGLEAAVFMLSIGSIFYFTDKYTQPVLIIISAIAGQILNIYDE